MLYQMMGRNGEIKDYKDLTTPVRPLLMEYLAVRAAMGKKLEFLKTFCEGNLNRLLLK